jgi:hypothetical protein
LLTNVSFSVAGMGCGHKHLFLHGWNVSWSKSSISVWLECVVISNCQFQHGWNGFFFFVFFGILCVQALPVKALVLQSWAVTPEMAARPSTHSFLSYRPPHCSAQTLADLRARWRHCYYHGGGNSDIILFVPSGTQGLQTPEHR